MLPEGFGGGRGLAIKKAVASVSDPDGGWSVPQGFKAEGLRHDITISAKSGQALQSLESLSWVLLLSWLLMVSWVVLSRVA